jgi:hypothetical protein
MEMIQHAPRKIADETLLNVRLFASTLSDGQRAVFWRHVRQIVRSRRNPPAILPAVGSASEIYLEMLCGVKVVTDAKTGDLLGIEAVHEERPRDVEEFAKLAGAFARRGDIEIRGAQGLSTAVDREIARLAEGVVPTEHALQ